MTFSCDVWYLIDNLLKMCWLHGIYRRTETHHVSGSIETHFIDSIASVREKTQRNDINGTFRWHLVVMFEDLHTVSENDYHAQR